MKGEKAKKSTKTKKVVRKTKQNVVAQPFTVPYRQDMEKYLKERILGQDEFIRKVLIAMYRRIMFGLRTNILVVGNSGSGKTETLKLIAEAMQLPYTIENATEYTQAGYLGSDIENIADHLYDNAKKRDLLDRLPLGIVIMDEIDKKAEDNDIGRGTSVSGKAVQQSLLKYMDGMEIPIYDDEPIEEEDEEEQVEKSVDKHVKEDLYFKPAVVIDTKFNIFICIGAFEGLSDIRDKRLKKNRIGFKQEDDTGKRNEAYIGADFIEYGMIKEFMGRFDCIAETKILGLEDIENIVRYSKISEFVLYENVLGLAGVDIVYTDALIKNIAKKAYELKIGARGIKTVTNYVFEKIMCEVMDRNVALDTRCVLEDDIVDDNTKFHFEAP